MTSPDRPFENLNLAAPNQQKRGFILRPSPETVALESEPRATGFVSWREALAERSGLPLTVIPERERLSYLQEFSRLAGRRAYFEACPRHTCGSPAMVSLGECLKLAIDECAARERNLTGVLGEECKAKAEAPDALRWIAFARWEAGAKVWRLDFLTGTIAPEPARLTWQDRDRWHELRGYAAHYAKIETEFPRELAAELAALELRAVAHREPEPKS